MENQERLRVLHIASWYPSKVHNSLGNFIQRHVRAISTKHTCELWYASPVSNENLLMGTIDVVNGDGFIERVAYPRATKPGVRAVTRSLLNFMPGEEVAMPDLVHLHVAFPAGRAARILAERWNVPLVITEHWTAYHDSQHIPLWRRVAMRRTALSTSVFCPVTEHLAGKMQEFKMRNQSRTETYKVIPNVVDTAKFNLGSRKRNKGDEVKILHVSSLAEDQKNITGILNTISTILRTRPEFNFSLTIVGGVDPKLLDKVRQYATSIYLEEPILKLTGAISGDEVAIHMKDCDAVLLFSRKENFPCVIAEAWACGKPVITTDVGGIAEHMHDERGILIKSDDEKALAQAILNLDKDWNEEAIRKYAVDVFSVEAVSKSYSEAYTIALKSIND